jgi:hypothetical protein
MQPALVVVANCVTVPSSLAHLMPAPDKASDRRKPQKSLLPAPLFTPQPVVGSSMDMDLQSSSSAEVPITCLSYCHQPIREKMPITI